MTQNFFFFILSLVDHKVGKLKKNNFCADSSLENNVHYLLFTGERNKRETVHDNN